MSYWELLYNTHKPSLLFVQTFTIKLENTLDILISIPVSNFANLIKHTTGLLYGNHFVKTDSVFKCFCNASDIRSSCLLCFATCRWNNHTFSWHLELGTIWSKRPSNIRWPAVQNWIFLFGLCLHWALHGGRREAENILLGGMRITEPYCTANRGWEAVTYPLVFLSAPLPTYHRCWRRKKQIA